MASVAAPMCGGGILRRSAGRRAAAALRTSSTLPGDAAAGPALSPSSSPPRRRRSYSRFDRSISPRSGTGGRRELSVGSTFRDFFGGSSTEGGTKAEAAADGDVADNSASASTAAASDPVDPSPPPLPFPTADPDAGLFTLPCLHAPPDFLRLAREAVTKCDALRSALASAVASETAASSIGNAIDTLHLLDEISNTVCSVIDAAELCRSAHASQQWRDGAEDAFGLLSGYIAELNSDDNLYRSLVSVTTNPDVFGQLNDEQRRFAILLKEEFERDGIHLPPEKREQVREVVGHITTLEGLFASNITRSRKFFNVSGDAESIIPRNVLRSVVPPEEFTEESGTTTISSDAHIANTLLKYSSNPRLRKEVYMEINTMCPENLDVLDSLVEQRHRLATLQGYESYAERFLQDKMAGSPAAVSAFLESVRKGVEPAYKQDMALIGHAKDQIEAGGGTIHPWDVPFYTGILKQQAFGEDNDLGGYFTVEGCVDGMAALVERLFGISMVEAPMTQSERWDVPDGAASAESAETDGSNDGKIRKFHFTHPEEGPLGTVYFDLHPREGKYAHAAHFTVKCGCAVRSLDRSFSDSSSSAPSSGTTAGNGTEYQLPVVALVCNLSPPHASVDGASLLSHSEVETLLHEFGHALHSLLGRTHFQHLAGTRAAMDFIETPSHIFENYAWDADFLRLIGRHYSTGEVLDDATIAGVIRGRYAFRSVEVQNQIVYSKFDQAVFGPFPSPSGSPRPSTTELFARLHNEHGVPFAEGTHWHSKFGHLVTYGAGYYGYLYSQVFAADVWSTVLSSPPRDRDSEQKKTGGGGGGGGALGRSGGMKLWNEVLRHGGARDPNVMLRNVLGCEPIGGGFFGDLSWRR